MSLLDDLVTFARIEVESHDVEPWAEVLREVDLPDIEARLWLVSLYNTFDDLGSAWRFYERWPTPDSWLYETGLDEEETAWVSGLWCSQERRGLRGGRVIRRIDSYVDLLAGTTQQEWLGRCTSGTDYEGDFRRTTELLRRVWGVGRQSAFEWAEFLAKSCGFFMGPVTAEGAQLWESSGPRKAIEMLVSPPPEVTATWLDEQAGRLMFVLDDRGVPLPWEDFETVLCDFRVMTKGRYYPGQHLASLREEIGGLLDYDLDEGYDRLLDAWHRVIPEPWSLIEPGIRATRRTEYARTGRIIDTP